MPVYNAGMELLLDNQLEQRFYDNALNTLNACKPYKFTEITTMDRVNGIYALYNGDKEVVYIGSAKDIRNRWVHHRNRNGSALMEKIIEEIGNENLSQFLEECTIKYVHVSIGRSELEDHLINRFNPIYNNYRKRKRYGVDKK